MRHHISSIATWLGIDLQRQEERHQTLLVPITKDEILNIFSSELPEQYPRR